LEITSNPKLTKKLARDNQPPNHGAPWTEKDEEFVKMQFTGGKTATDIGNLLGRSRGSIWSKLKGLPDPNKKRDLSAAFLSVLEHQNQELADFTGTKSGIMQKANAIRPMTNCSGFPMRLNSGTELPPPILSIKPSDVAGNSMPCKANCLSE
jgi:hypothetical protein